MQRKSIIKLEVATTQQKGGYMKVDVDKLNEEIQKKEWSINKLAKHSGVDKSTISRLLNGRSCSVATAQSLVSALGISSKKAGSIFFGN